MDSPESTPQQAAEAALRDREAELARVQRIGRVGGFEIDLRGGQFRNRRSPEYLSVHGLPPDAADEAHEAWVRRLHPEDRVQAETHFKTIVAGTGRHYAAEYRIVVAGEGVRWIAATAEIERDEHGAPLRMIGVHIDITRSKDAEQALRESEARLREVLAAIGEAFYTLDAGERFASVSRRALEMWRLDEAQVLGRRIDAVFPGVAGGATYQEMRRTMLTGTPSRVEGRSVSLHGRWVEQDAYPTAGGGVAVAFRDIHDRKQTELALRQSEARFRAAVAAVSGIVWSTDAAGRMAGAQAGWAALTGQAQHEYQGLGWAEAVHPEDRAATLAAWAASVTGGGTFMFEHRLRDAGGAWRRFAVRAVPVAGVEGGIREWVGVHTDITADRQVRDELARLNLTLETRVREEVAARETAQARLEQAQRMQALGQLAGGIAHDFNNVLQSIQGGAALIARRPHDQEAVRRLAGMLHDATERGSSVTRRLLAFSRRGELRAEPLDAEAVLAGLQELLQHTLGGGVRVELEVAPGLKWLLADKGQLETVLVNLATNARDAMPGGGRLTMAAAMEVVTDGETGEAELAAGPYVRLTVRDTGTGMDARTLAHATEPFFSTKALGQGTGLGLAMARGFARQSGGDLHIATRPGEGTAVTLWLPASDVPPRPVVAAPLPVARRSQAAVLLAEDDALVRQTLAAELEAEGYRVVAVAGGRAALAALDSGMDCDVLVSDLSMPEIDGVALIAAAQRRRKLLPAILLTGFATEATGLAVGGSLDSAFSLLRKPITGQALAERIAVLLAGAPAP